MPHVSLFHYIILNCKAFEAETMSQQRELELPRAGWDPGLPFWRLCMRLHKWEKDCHIPLACGIPPSALKGALVVIKSSRYLPLSGVGSRRIGIKDLNLLLAFYTTH